MLHYRITLTAIVAVIRAGGILALGRHWLGFNVMGYPSTIR